MIVDIRESAVERAVSTKMGLGESTVESVPQMRRFLSAFLFSIIYSLSLTAAPALALKTHIPTLAFGALSSAPANPYPLSNPSDVAVDTSTGPSAGDVYVTDPSNHRIEKFSSSGQLLLMFGKGVNQTTRTDVCAAAEACQAGALGSSPGEFETPTFVDVDDSTGPSAGDVYVGDTGNDTISKFDPNGNLIATWGTGGQLDVPGSRNFSGVGLAGMAVGPSGELIVLNAERLLKFAQDGSMIEEVHGVGAGRASGVAVDSAGDIFNVEEARGEVQEFGPTGGQLKNSFAPGPSTGLAIDTGDGLYVSYPEHVSHYDSSDDLLEEFGSTESISSGAGLALGEHGKVYDADSGSGEVSVFQAAIIPDITTGEATNVGQRSATLHGHLELGGEGAQNITSCRFEYVTEAAFTANGYSGAATALCSPNPASSPPSSNFSTPTDVSAEISGLTSDVTYHYRLTASNPEGGNISQDRTFTPHAVVEITTDPAASVTQTSATLNGSFVGTGERVEYHFEYGSADCSANPCTSIPIPAADAGSPSGPERTEVSVGLAGLTPLTGYHYRIVATDSVGTSFGNDQMLQTLPQPPDAGAGAATDIGSDVATLHAPIKTEGGDTKYHFEYVDESAFKASGYSNATRFPVPDADIGTNDTEVTRQIGGLTPGTTYYYRVVAENSGGTTNGADSTFNTFSSGGATDTCANAHVRQQTSAALLPDCRAYELISAANTDGYNVESDLVAGQTPFGGYPQASGAAEPSRLLYSVHYGGIPGVGEPTNYGNDPYVATRGKEGWSTEYVGIPASGTPSNLPFASSVLEANASLDTFAFGGSNICSPCFANGSSGIPLHLPNGSLVQGMAGSLDPGPSAKPDGYIAKRFSADGNHFVFGSTSQFEPEGNSNGDVSIYDRDLATGETHVVSKAPEGEEGNLRCIQGEGECHSPGDSAGISELDISSDGTRILLGQLISADAKGNKYWHLYMNIGDSEHTIDLTPGSTHGVLFDGMTSDGSKVFFTTVDQLTTPTNQDTDTSADIYEAEVSESGATLTRVSTGIDGTGNTNSCDPTGNWNTVSGELNCSAVAIGGGGGVAAANGTIYFLSPELLDGPSSGVQNEPNLYVARSGSPPHFVATLESTATDPRPPVLKTHPFVRTFGSLTDPMGVAADQASDDVYVTDPGNFRIERFDASGNLVSIFGGEVNKTKVEEREEQEAKDEPVTVTVQEVDLCTVASHDTCQPGAEGVDPGEFSNPAFIAVDNSTSPTDPSVGDVYVGDIGDDEISKFDASGNLIASWGTAGQLDGSSATDGPFGESFGGLAVGQSGELFVVNSRFGLYEFSQDGSFLDDHGFGPSVGQDGLAVDSHQNLFFLDRGGCVNEVSSSGTTITGAGAARSAPCGATGVAVDPSDGLYVSYPTQVVHFDSSGNTLEESSAEGHIESGAGVALDGKEDLYVSNSASGDVAEFNPPVPPENPAVFDAVNAAGTRNTGDFQVNPSGEAVFGTALPLKAGYNNATHFEIYRYDAVSEELDCISCSPTNAPATGDSTLASNGLSLTNDGRVFFNSTDVLAARDQDEKADVYEWEPRGDGTPQCQAPGGCIGLISTGTSRFDSSLLGASADGTDVFFFTHDTLVPQDENGELAKIYDARELGGFLLIPKPVPCKASDECHGPSSQAAPPPNIGSFEGSGGNAVVVKKKKPRLNHHHRKHRRRKHSHHGASKHG